MVSRTEALARLTAEGTFEVVEDHAHGYPQRVYRNAPPSFRAIVELSRRFGERPFLIYGEEVLTYAGHFGKVAALAHYLRAIGVDKGDRIAIGMRNYPEWVISFWACQAIGAVSVAINAWWTGPEIAFALEDSQPAALLIDGERLERLEPFIGAMQGLRGIVVARRGDVGPGGVDFDDVTATPAAALPEADVGPADHATILYTSGTTGKPKGALATQRNHMTNVMNTLLAGAVARGMLDDFSAVDALETPQGGILQTFPYFHIGGLTGLYLATATGAKVALMYKWNPLEAVRLVETHRLSGVSGVPIVVRQLLEAARSSGADVSSIVGVTSGGAPVPPDLIRRIETQFSGKALPGNGYGLTETTSAIITNGGADYFANPDSIGRPVPTCEAIIVDEQGGPLGDDEIGELWVRGPNVIPGYWQNPEATEAAFGGGWFRTGDLGYRSAEGLYYVVDRKKDVVIRGGENVYCAEVEAAILEHAMVRDVAIVGLPDAEYGEQVAAVIQVADLAEAATLPDALRAMLQTKIARFKVPTSYRLTLDDLPRTATGKVLKRALRDMFAGENS